MQEANNRQTKFVQDHMWFSLYPVDPRETELTAFLQQCKQMANKLSNGYIWQQEQLTFNLGDNASIPCIKGGLRFGDNIEDEWFSTYIIAEITKQMPLAANLEDTDGCFLLIEVADALPDWLNPETARNRVFICNGSLHIVPQPASPADIGIFPQGTVALEQALLAIRTYPHRTLANPAVQHILEQRLGMYPQNAYDSMHHTKAFLPKPILKVSIYVNTIIFLVWFLYLLL